MSRANQRPNFLIFMTDMLSAGLLDESCPARLPHVERLAKEGVSFSRASTPTAHCCPARATFFTGLYPSRHGVWNNVVVEQAFSRGLKPGVRLFSEDLAEAGYRLAFSGKWHVSAEEGPDDRGWEVLSAKERKGVAPSQFSWDFWRRMAQKPTDNRPRGRGEILLPGWTRDLMYGVAEGQRDLYDDPHWSRVIEPALAALPGLASQSDPWCLYVAPPDRKCILPEKYARLYDPADIALPESYRDTMEDKPRFYQRLRRTVYDQLTEAEAREFLAHFYGYWTMIDEMFGALLGALDETGAADNTVVIFLGDHGSYGGAHGLFWIGAAPFLEEYNIPLVVRWPQGIVQPGRVVDEFVTLADVAPTLLELAGCAVPPGLTGRSLAPFLRNEIPADWPDAFFSQYNGTELYFTQRMVVTKDYKYVYNGFDFDELYDLKADPHEMVNLAARPEYEPVIREMIGRMWRFACREDDIVQNGYTAVAVAPYGPADGLRTQDR